MQLLFEIRIRKTCKPLTLDHFNSHNLNLHSFKVATDMIEYRRKVRNINIKILESIVYILDRILDKE